MEILFHLLFYKKKIGFTFSLYCIVEQSMLSSRKSAAEREKLHLNPNRRQEKYPAASSMQNFIIRAEITEMIIKF